MANAIAGSLINLNFTEKGKVKKKIYMLMYATCMWVAKENRMGSYIPGI